jgi:predicted nucleotidyltransferase
MKTIFSTLVGSRLYGTSIEGSDYDYKAVALPDAEDLLGLRDTAREHWEVKNPNDTPGETVVYSVAKFLTLFMSGNPTVTELVFSCPVYCPETPHDLWTTLVKPFALSNLLSDKIVGSYGGYINDQFKRVKARKAQNNREFMIEKYGFDIKCSGHVYRLAIQGKVLVSTGTCEPTLTGTELATCLSIRKGEKTFEETVDILTKVVAEYDEAAKATVLPKFDKEKMEHALHRFLVKLHASIVVSQYEK